MVYSCGSRCYVTACSYKIFHLADLSPSAGVYPVVDKTAQVRPWHVCSAPATAAGLGRSKAAVRLKEDATNCSRDCCCCWFVACPVDSSKGCRQGVATLPLMLLMTVPNTDTPKRQNKPNAIEAVQFGHAERYFEILYEGNVAMSVLGSKLGSVLTRLPVVDCC